MQRRQRDVSRHGCVRQSLFDRPDDATGQAAIDFSVAQRNDDNASVSRSERREFHANAVLVEQRANHDAVIGVVEVGQFGAMSESAATSAYRDVPRSAAMVVSQRPCWGRAGRVACEVEPADWGGAAGRMPTPRSALEEVADFMMRCS